MSILKILGFTLTCKINKNKKQTIPILDPRKIKTYTDNKLLTTDQNKHSKKLTS